MKVLLNTAIALAFTIISLSASAGTQKFEQAAGALCEHTKKCALASMEGEEISPEMKQMMTSMLDGACNAMRAGFDPALQSHELYQPATQCMASMTKLSCQEMENMESVNTPECTEFERLTQQQSK